MPCLGGAALLPVEKGSGGLCLVGERWPFLPALKRGAVGRALSGKGDLAACREKGSGGTCLV